MSKNDRIRKRQVAQGLEPYVDEAAKLARKLGLDPYPVNYWIVDHDEMNELIAYDGFQKRYPHWRWGMNYDRQRKQRQFLGGKAFEIVNNNDPSHAFLQESNSLADQKAVITHVEAHADFFRNNRWFRLFDEGASYGSVDGSPTTPGSGPDAAAMLASHAETVTEYVNDPDIDREAVEEWVDHVACLDGCIDQHRAYRSTEEWERESPETGEETDTPEELAISEEVRDEVFDEEWREEHDPGEDALGEKDLLAYLAAHGRAYDEETGRAVEYEEWQRELLEILRRESYYFAPQRMTKVMNEGWACVAPDTRVFTEDGLVEMQEVVGDRPDVSDGDTRRRVYDANVIEDHDMVRIETRRGFELTGSNNHRIRRPDGEWVRLDELEVGDTIEVSGGDGCWPAEYVELDWETPEYTTLDDVAEQAGVSISTVLRYRELGRAERADAIEEALESYDPDDVGLASRDPIRIPGTVSEQFGRFLGLLIGDGHVPESSRHVGFTAGEKPKAEEFAGLCSELFGVEPTVEEQEGRWRVYAYSKHLRDLLIGGFGLPTGRAAAKKTVPEQVLHSPKSVVSAFIQGLFDADGYAGDHGTILSTKSESLSRIVQLMLTNYGILSRRHQQSDGCYHVHLTGESASRFANEIGFGYDEKQTRLETYVDDLAWLEEESWTTEVTSIEHDIGDVYDISVETTHRYAAAGFVNHNSKWESLMMTGENFADDDEFVSYADHMAQVLGSPGLNPYALGLELWTYVENRANRREVLEKLLRVEGVTPATFDDRVDLDEVLSLLEPAPEIANVVDHLDELDADDPRVDSDGLAAARDGAFDVDSYPWKVLSHEGLVERHYSLVQPANRGFLKRTTRETLDRIDRYLFERDRYGTVREALADVEYDAGWDRMFAVRESHNDVTFIDEYLTEEFVEAGGYFTYEYSHRQDDYRATSTDPADVKRKLLLQFTNFGKPTVTVHDDNFGNRNELLLAHQYNGVALDVPQAKRVLERVFELWGRPVQLLTVVKEVDERDVKAASRRGQEPEPAEVGVRYRYDGDGFERIDVDREEWPPLSVGAIGYDTKPDEWLE
ncbi:SpoVR family protein [Halobacteriales archaeon QH_7_66_36]|nr:MAG: SpoVR family protein [Halobacteriales archaeon QH_7_66_36]